MRTKSVVAVPAILLSASLVAGCGPSSTTASGNSSTSNSTSTASSSAPATSSSAADTSSSNCPTSNTRSFAKTRLVADLGLAVGTFHRYLWKPYQAGTFNKGANGRIKAIIKGAAAGALDVKLLDNAKKNVQANPTLCKVLYQPISDALGHLGNLKGDITSGNFASLTSLESVFTDLKGKAANSGAPITETSN